MSDSHTVNVRKDFAAPLGRRLTALARFVYQKLHDVIVGSIALVLSALATLYIVFSLYEAHSETPAISWIALVGFGFVLWITLDNIFHGEQSAAFIAAGSVVISVCLIIGFTFAVLSVPFWLVIAFCAALALGAWIVFIPAIGLFGSLEWLDDQADAHYLKSRRQAVAAAGRFVVTEFQATAHDGDEPYFGDDEPQYVVEDTEKGAYYELPDEVAAYRLIDGILKQEAAKIANTQLRERKLKRMNRNQTPAA